MARKSENGFLGGGGSTPSSPRPQGPHESWEGVKNQTSKSLSNHQSLLADRVETVWRARYSLPIEEIAFGQPLQNLKIELGDISVQSGAVNRLYRVVLSFPSKRMEFENLHFHHLPAFVGVLGTWGRWGAPPTTQEPIFRFFSHLLSNRLRLGVKKRFSKFRESYVTSSLRTFPPHSVSRVVTVVCVELCISVYPTDKQTRASTGVGSFLLRITTSLLWLSKLGKRFKTCK